jgi:hypothetical protein
MACTPRRTRLKFNAALEVAGALNEGAIGDYASPLSQDHIDRMNRLQGKIEDDAVGPIVAPSDPELDAYGRYIPSSGGRRLP